MLDAVAGMDLGDELLWEPMRIVPPGPWTGHLPFAFWLVKALRPSTLVELGTHSGNSYFGFCQAMAAFVPGGRAYAVDTWVGDEHAGNYGEDVFAGVSAFNQQHFGQFSTLLRATFDDARAYFPKGQVDLLHIDGMHSYEAVRHDFEMWQDALSTRAVVVFHDTNVRERDFGVWRFWNEVREQYPAFEFDHSNGLGVLGVGPQQTPALQALFAMPREGDEAATFRRRLSTRGQAFQWQAEALAAHEHFGKTHERTRHDIVALQSQLAAMEHQAAEAALAAERQRAELSWRDALLATQREVTNAKDAMIASLGNVAAGRNEALTVRDQVIVQREAHIMQLLGEVEQQRFRASEERRVREEMQAGYEKAIGHLERTIEQVRHETAHAVTTSVTASVSEAVARSVAQTYINTTSWRATRPLRAVVRRLKREGPAPAISYAPLPLAVIPAPVVPPPMVELPPIAAESPAVADPLAAADLTTVTPRKQAVRDLFSAQLQAFLGSSSTLHLPRADQPDISIILVLFNQAELTFACLSSIVETLRKAPFGVEVVIADNASTDDTSALLEQVEGAVVIRNRSNLHFLRAVNAAARQATGRTILLLNNDAQLLPGALASALRTLDSDPVIGAVGGRIILPDGTLQEAGSIIWRDGTCSGYARGDDPTAPDVMFQRDVDYCSGAFLLTKAALWRQMGGFDERFAPAYYEETDYCVRLWEGGYRVVYDPDAAILHYEFGSSTASGDALRLQAANHAVFVTQHGDWLAGQFPVSPLNVLPARTARGSRPRILVLEDRVPKVELGTGYPRANRLLHEMVEAGADVTFFPMFRHYETWRSIRAALDKRIEVLWRAEAPQLRDYLMARRGHFDAVLVCRPQNMRALMDAIGPERSLLGGATLLYDAEALFATRELQRRGAAGEVFTDLDRHRMIAEEVSLTRMASAVISVSPAEQGVLEDYGAREVHLLGHTLDDQPISTAYGERDQIVFLGAIGDDNAPNADAVRWFAADILPQLRSQLDDPELRLTVIGRNGADTISVLDGVTVDLLGMVDELPPALARARIMVVPTRYAAGIPHKVHQAAMLGIPTIVTSLIAGQLGWQDGSELLVGDDPASFADACARLYRDETLWQQVRTAALDRARLDCAPAMFTRKVQEIVSGLTLVRREPAPLPGETRREPPATTTVQAPSEPGTSRPASDDWSVATPFGFSPLDAPVPPVAVICHMFHIAIVRELLFYLQNLPGKADLFISTDTEEKRAELERACAAWDKGGVELRVVPNRGRDIAPKLVGFADVYGRYDLVLHLHSKMSNHAAFLQPWRSYLFETLLGSPEVVRSNMDAFARLPDLGLLAPQHYEGIRRWLGWNGNFTAAKGMASRMGVSLSPTRALDFPSGSMFWARPAALRPLLDLGMSFDDFPGEGAQTDHTPAHVIERLFFYACESSGHTWLKVARPALMMETATVVEIATPAALSQFVAEHGVALTGPGRVTISEGPAPMVTRVPPGLASRLASRAL
jgi:GT2 family glycosyltransferase